MRKLIDKADSRTKDELGVLMSGGTISKIIKEDITYDEVYYNQDNLWNFMFFTGYLKKVDEHSDGLKIFYDLTIPNKELQYIYETKVQDWFEEQVSQKDFSKFHQAVLNGDAKTVQEELSAFLMDTISYMDSRESFYHGLMLGLLSGMQYYSVKSNREAGNGRSDIFLKPTSRHDKAVIFELKWTKDIREIEKKAEEALQQIEANNYVRELEAECYNDVIKYGIAFCKKSCEVRTA